jgi:uncharacterized protein
MSQENVEIVRRAFEAFNQGDPDLAVAALAPDCEYIPSGAVPDATETYRGPEGYKRFMRWLLDEFDDVQVDINEIIEAGDRVMISLTSRGRGRRSGVETNWAIWQVWTLRDGRVLRGEGFTSREDAVEAVGLRE